MTYRVRSLWQHRRSGRVYDAVLIGGPHTATFVAARGLLPPAAIAAYAEASSGTWPVEPTATGRACRVLNRALTRPGLVRRVSVPAPPPAGAFDVAVTSHDAERIAQGPIVAGAPPWWRRVWPGSALYRVGTTTSERGDAYDILWDPGTRTYDSLLREPPAGTGLATRLRAHSSFARALAACHRTA